MNWNAFTNPHDINNSTKKVNTFTFHDPHTTTQKEEEGSDGDNDYRSIDVDEYSDDDEYEPIEFAAWGDNAKISSNEPASWNNLIDTSIKVKAGGVGSGDLHRRGGNFKPLSEAVILAQRLNKPVPGAGKKKSKTSGAARKRKKKAVSSKPVSHITSARKSYLPPVRPTTVFTLPERKPAPNAPPSTWGSKPLVETPFWEVKKTPDSPPTTPVPKTTTNTTVITTSTTSTTTTTTTIMNKRPIKVTASIIEPIIEPTKFVKGIEVAVQTDEIAVQQNNASTASKWNPGAAGFTPSAKPKTLSNNWNANASTFNPSSSTFSLSSQASTASSTYSSPVKLVYDTGAPEFLPFVQLPVKKAVKISAPTPSASTSSSSSTAVNTQTQTQATPAISNNPLLRKQLMDIQKYVSATPSPQSVAQPPPTVEKPYIKITLELTEGISAVIDLYQDSQPRKVVEDFAKRPSLIVTDETKANISRTIEHLLNAKRNKEYLREQNGIKN